MRRPNRHIEIFSISALDLFASALGAFILVAIILFPYYLKDQDASAKLATTAAELEAARRDAATALDAKEAALREAQAARAAADAKAASLQAELDRSRTQQPAGKAFLVVGVRWATPDADIDLHVTDPAGHEFFWFKNNTNRRDFPGSTAELSYDMTSGPAVELWQDPAAAPGPYVVDYVANGLPDGYTAEVSGTVFDRDGRHDLPPKVLRHAKERVRGALIDVGSDGRVTIR